MAKCPQIWSKSMKSCSGEGRLDRVNSGSQKTSVKWLHVHSFRRSLFLLWVQDRQLAVTSPANSLQPCGRASSFQTFRRLSRWTGSGGTRKCVSPRSVGRQCVENVSAWPSNRPSTPGRTDLFMARGGALWPRVVRPNARSSRPIWRLVELYGEDLVVGGNKNVEEGHSMAKKEASGKGACY